ncbi:hypothetical protein AVEN_230654-1 [Araneus ventricosus]|uniref:Transposase Tc1-like domain-containing protein n=1 Tax=Araneus ventricosus TaxID=182803 RepID=A0A4Y2A1K6_ARAVE|nr:hypothetical protein AVEN_230654-1 [Araneus ventricosus]
MYSEVTFKLRSWKLHSLTECNVGREWLLKHMDEVVVCNLWKQFQDTGSIERKPGQGRPRATTVTEDRYLSIIARRNRSATASQLSRDLYAATGTRVTRVTFQKTS